MRRIGIALIVAGAACSKQTPKASEPVEASAPSATSIPSTSTPTAAPASIETVRLLDTGQPPRRALRYAWKLDRRESLAMDLRTSASTEAGGSKQEIPLPPVHIVVAIDPKGVSPDGDLSYAWSVTEAAVTSDPKAPSQVAEGMRAEVAAVAHLAGSAVVTSRGLPKDVRVEDASMLDAGAATGQMVEQVRQTLLQLSAPLPEEDVGKGARWQALTELDSKDARITQTETFTLTDVAGDKGSLDDVLAQTAPPQPLRMPEGRQARMHSMLASGDAKIRFDLSRVVPQRKFDGTTRLVLGMDGSGKVAMTMKIAIGITGTLR